MKKIVAVALCLVMVIGLMTGCQKGMDVETLIQKMDEAMKTVTAQSAEVEMDLDMKITTTGVSMNMGMDMDMGIRAKSDFSAAYVDMTMAMEALGQTEETSMEMYAATEDGAMVSYVHESTTDTWVKSVEENFSESMGELMGMEQTMTEMPKEMLSLAKKQETVNDRKCYVLTAEMKGEVFQEYMGEYMEQMMTQISGAEEMDQESQAAMESMADMDWSTLSAKAVYYVDAETFLPLEMTVEVQGMGETMSAMVETMMGALAAGEDVEFSLEVSTFQIVMKNMAYNEDVEIPAVPQEAIDNAIDADAAIEDPVVDDPAYSDISLTNEPQADGSYLLSLENDKVSVMVPEGYIVYAAENEMVAGMTEDMLNSVNYMLVGDVTGEDMRLSLLEEIDWANENGYYKSHSEVAELNGFSTMSLIYNDDTSIWYAWKELNGCVLLMGAEVQGETFDLAALIAGVEIAAE